MSKLKLAAALASAVALASAATALGHTAHAAGGTVIVTTKHTSLGTVLVNASGRGLYLDQGDKPPHFACQGGCLKAWPPLKATGKLKAEGSAKQADLGTVKGPGGIKMVTYKGHPLYAFVSDTSGKPTSGEGVNGFWLVSPSGSKVSKTTTTTTTSSSSSSGGYGY
jgi:predicted lipoprotein with Yx(FWY)xxD motif